jgi:hypothetical protein
MRWVFLCSVLSAVVAPGADAAEPPAQRINLGPAQRIDVSTANARYAARVAATREQFSSSALKKARELGKQNELKPSPVVAIAPQQSPAPPQPAPPPAITPAPAAAPLAPPNEPPAAAPPALVAPVPPPPLVLGFEPWRPSGRQRTDPWNNPYGVQYDDPALQGGWGRFEDPVFAGLPSRRITGQGKSGPITGQGKSGPITGRGKSGPITGQGKSGPITGLGKAR